MLRRPSWSSSWVGSAAACAGAIALAAAAVLAAGCARPGLPGGGPPDETPPHVVRTAPADGATLVPPATPIEVEFSEEMNRTTVERALAVFPPTALGRMRWRGPALLATPAAELPDSTTFVVTVGAGAQDDHGVPMAAAASFAFSTGPVVDDCVVAGDVGKDGAPVAGATVWLLAAPAAADSTGRLAPSGRAALSGADGGFRFARVRASRAPYSLVAFLDADRDGHYDPSRETGAAVDGAALVAAPGDSAVGISIALGPPRAGEGGAQ